jgi:hypothetical protein
MPALTPEQEAEYERRIGVARNRAHGMQDDHQPPKGPEQVHFRCKNGNSFSMIVERNPDGSLTDSSKRSRDEMYAALESLPGPRSTTSSHEPTSDAPSSHIPNVTEAPFFREETREVKNPTQSTAEGDQP